MSNPEERAWTVGLTRKNCQNEICAALLPLVVRMQKKSTSQVTGDLLSFCQLSAIKHVVPLEPI